MNINKDNYEEWMVSFIDGELSTHEINVFNEFINAHPELRNELDDFEETKFIADDNVVFEQKELLHRKEGILIFLKKSLPYAAVIAIVLGTILFLSNKENTTKIVKEEKETPKKKNELVVPEQKKYDSTSLVQVKSQQVEKKENMLPIEPTPTKRIVNALKIRRKKTPIKEPRILVKKEIRQPLETPKQELIKKDIERLSPEPRDPPKQEIVVKQEQPLHITDNVKTVTPDQISKEALLVINEKSHPIIHDKINEVVIKVEDRIEKIKQLKQQPITVSIGKLKLFTLNN